MNRSIPIRDALHEVMQRGARTALSDDEFNALALQAFQFQFENVGAYQRYCERRQRSPQTVTHWSQIPPVPTAAFKEVPLTAGTAAAAKLVFRTSGTTRGAEKRGTHYISEPSLYDAALLAGFREFVLPDRASMPMLALAPPFEQQPDSSLGYMISVVLRELGKPGQYVASVDGGLDVPQARQVLERAGSPLCILGTSLAFLHLLDGLHGAHVKLPEGSRLMDTGGFKGDEREITGDELRARYREQLGLTERYCVNEYGMTELCSQYYDAALRDDTDPTTRLKKGPSWIRPRVLDPDTLEEVTPGETGILAHFDLANLNSVSAVLTEDLAYQQADGFVLLGRAPGAMPRGCSIAMDILLKDTQPS